MKCKESDCQSSCEKHKKCETPTGCGSCCGGGHDCSDMPAEIITTSVSMVADCSKNHSSRLSNSEKKDDLLNVINDLEIHYTKIYEEHHEFFMLNKLMGITNLQHAEEIPTTLEGCIYEEMEELVDDLNKFLKANKELSIRMAEELDIYFLASAQ